MGAVIVLTPVVVAAWPTIAAVATGALASLGYAAVRRPKRAEEPSCVTLDLPQSSVLAEGLRDEERLSFQKGAISLEVQRGAGGSCTLRVTGAASAEELRAAGQQAVDAITRQYAYHRLITELKERHFEVVAEEVQEDRSIKLRVRQWKA